MIIKRKYILELMLLAMLIQFSPLDEYIRQTLTNGKSATNYIITFVLLFFVFMFKNIPVNKNALKIIGILFCIYLINFAFAPFKNWSWFLYQGMFFLTALQIASIYSRIDSIEYEIISRNIKRICNAFIPIIVFVSIYLLVKYHARLAGISKFSAQNVFNGYIWRLYLDFDWDKNRVGGAIATVFCHILTLPKKKLRDIFLLFPILPIIAAIRHFLLGSFLTIIFMNIKKIRVFFLIIFVTLVLSFVFRGKLVSILRFDVRGMGFANTVDIITKYPFGVGNGAYHTFVINNMASLTNKYSNLGKYMPVSPESDVIYVFGSFGLLCGFIFYTILVMMLFKLWRLYPSLSYPDKFFALLFIYFFFAGIGEDWMVSFSYWIMFGFALGVVIAKRNTIKLILKDGRF